MLTATCRKSWTSLRRFSTYLVSTPVYYVNANPHIGHVYTLFLAEGVKNVLNCQGHNAYLTTGSDEHGLKIQQMAESKGMTPLQLAETQSAIFRQLFDLCKVDYDVFLRTEEQEHKDLIEEAWRTMVKRGRISFGKHSGYYCTSDESFVPESELLDKEGLKFTELGHPALFVEEDTLNFMSWAL